MTVQILHSLYGVLACHKWIELPRWLSLLYRHYYINEVLDEVLHQIALCPAFSCRIPPLTHQQGEAVSQNRNFHASLHSKGVGNTAVPA